MAKKKLSLRTLGIIEHMWSRGISAVSIAGSTQARLDRVESVIRKLEAAKRAPKQFAAYGQEIESETK